MVTIFLEDGEAEEDMKQVQKHNEHYDKKLKKSHHQKPLPEQILEPVPCEEHLYCTLCKIQFESYLEHIFSEIHS